MSRQAPATGLAWRREDPSLIGRRAASRGGQPSLVSSCLARKPEVTAARQTMHGSSGVWADDDLAEREVRHEAEEGSNTLDLLLELAALRPAEREQRLDSDRQAPPCTALVPTPVTIPSTRSTAKIPAVRPQARAQPPGRGTAAPTGGSRPRRHRSRAAAAHPATLCPASPCRQRLPRPAPPPARPLAAPHRGARTVPRPSLPSRQATARTAGASLARRREDSAAAARPARPPPRWG
jgi:hypothetical protein